MPDLQVAGTLVATQAGDCAVHEFVTGSGDEFPHPRLSSDCRLTGAPVSGRIAYGVGGFGRVARFRFVDLVQVGLRLPVESGSFETIIWSPDGQRAAWCRGTREAFELEFLGARRRRLARCPALYLPGGRLAYIQGRRLVTRRTTVYTARRPIEFAVWPPNGRLFLVLAGGVAVSPPSRRVRIPGWSGIRPVVSPDGCAGLVQHGAEIVVAAPCKRGLERAYAGGAGAWSPDGKWLAIATGDHVDFYDLGHSETKPAASWDWAAASLLWR